MSSYSTNEFKNGLKVMVDNAPCSIVECEFVKPGKGQAFTRVKIRNLKNGRVVERTFKSGDSLEAADVIDVEMQYLYYDNEFWHLMDTESFEQYIASPEAMGDCQNWIKEQDMVTVTLWDNSPLQIVPPNFVILKIVETDPGLKGDTSGGGSKPATLETGAIVRIPLFVQEGELIKIDTRNQEYVSRVRS